MKFSGIIDNYLLFNYFSVLDLKDHLHFCSWKESSCMKLHPKSKNHVSHPFFIIFRNLMKIQLWDSKHVVNNTGPNNVQNLSFLALVLFE